MQCTRQLLLTSYNLRLNDTGRKSIYCLYQENYSPWVHLCGFCLMFTHLIYVSCLKYSKVKYACSLQYGKFLLLPYFLNTLQSSNHHHQTTMLCHCTNYFFYLNEWVCIIFNILFSSVFHGCLDTFILVGLERHSAVYIYFST